MFSVGGRFEVPHLIEVPGCNFVSHGTKGRLSGFE
jgi:hypothetical protein